MKWLFAGAAIALISGSAGAQPPPPGYAPMPPPTYAPIPPPRREFVPPPPGPRVVWEPGHWHWNGFRYVWFGGHYVERRPEYGRYAEGRWVWGPREGRWIWRRAHWE